MNGYLYRLTKRELEIYKLISRQSLTAKEISKILGISNKTVNIHIRNINNKIFEEGYNLVLIQNKYCVVSGFRV